MVNKMSLSRPKRINDIHHLQPAQHIYMHKRRFGFIHYQHHGIIMSVDTESNTFDLLHYFKPSLFERIRAVRGPIDFEKYSKKGIYLIQYEEGECLDDDDVLDKAHECIGNTDFNLFTRNSENLAQYCKTGSYAEPKSKRSHVVRYESMSGELYEHPRDKVTSIMQLARGDHLVFLRGKFLYEHHAIIIAVDQLEDKLHVAHFSKNKKSKKKLDIREETIDYSPRCKLFRVFYDDQEALDTEEVVSTALNLVGRKTYNLLKYNCEHFATKCKTDKHFCEQLRSVTKWAVNTGMDLVPRGVRSFAYILDDVLAFIARSLKFTKIIKAGAFVGSIAVESALCIWKIVKAAKLYEKGKISLEILRRKVATYVLSGSMSVGGSVGGAVLGALAGSAISPGLGTILGAIAGGMAGGVMAGSVPQGVATLVNVIEQNAEVKEDGSGDSGQLTNVQIENAAIEEEEGEDGLDNSGKDSESNRPTDENKSTFTCAAIREGQSAQMINVM